MKKNIMVLALATVGFLSINGSAWAVGSAGCTQDSDCTMTCPKGKTATCHMHLKGKSDKGNCSCRENRLKAM